MKTYYSTFISGLSEHISQVLKDELSDVEIIKVLDGLIIFKTKSNEKQIKQIPFFNNTFLLIRLFTKLHSNPIEEMLRLISNDNLSKKIRFNTGGYNRTFRIIISNANKLVSANNTLKSALEKKIKTVTGLHVNRSKPDFEFWILYRSEGIGLFSLRMTTHTSYEKILEKGELRPELCDALIRISKPHKTELFLDPFCGSGAIPIYRAKRKEKGLVFASDIDNEIILNLKAKVKKLGLKDKMIVRYDDALSLSRYKDNSIDKIVTDPPWGFYAQTHEDLDTFYSKMINELIRILKPLGTIVILIGQEEIFERIIEQCKSHLLLKTKYNILVSGKKAKIYELQKKIS